MRSVSKTSIHLSWVASRSDARVAGYRMLLNGSRVGTSLSTSYVFSGLHCGTSYTLGVRAVDAARHVSRTATIAAATAACSGSAGGSAFACYGADSSCYTPLSCTTTISSGLQTAIAKAANGAVICLRQSGSPYPALSTSSAKTKDVTIQPAPGATVSIGGLDLTRGASHLVFQGLTINGALLAGTTHISMIHDTFLSAAQVCVEAACSSSEGPGAIVPAFALFDYDRFDNIDCFGEGCYGEARLNVLSDNNGGTVPVHVTVSHSHFGGDCSYGCSFFHNGHAGCSDGVGSQGDVNGEVIGPGNEFTNLAQSGCPVTGPNAVHVDPIQSYTMFNVVITGNWFHDNGDGSGALGFFSGAGSSGGEPSVTFTYNAVGVASTSALGGQEVNLVGTEGAVVDHNVFYGGAGIGIGTDNQGDDSINQLYTNNVFAGGGGIVIHEINGTGSHAYTANYNLNGVMRGHGSNNITGTPIFIGGNKPTSYAGYRLAPRSRGTRAASDGGDMGIPVSGVLGGGLVVQGLVWSVVVVFESPVFEEQLRFEQAVEALHLEAALVGGAVEGFDERILPRVRPARCSRSQCRRSGTSRAVLG